MWEVWGLGAPPVRIRYGLSSYFRRVAIFVEMPLLVFMYAMSFLNHLQASTVRDLEDAITTDLTENAVFAYVDPGVMAHKNLHDVH